MATDGSTSVSATEDSHAHDGRDARLGLDDSNPPLQALGSASEARPELVAILVPGVQ
jgi:hypothetical protein